ncbi:ABC transporter permease [Lichenihabitans psoromatis]|uniref:ABC transporter permease n=1 Tax=Lichenihabitans psoromatis TaxID=2528642 RepID=UPI0013F16062|nr:ABC transporter permease [Lichenihabitans psoromatis]
MTTSALSRIDARPLPRSGHNTHIMPVGIVGAVILIVWYGLALVLNGPQATARLAQTGAAWRFGDFVRQAFTASRPLLPTPDQIVGELVRTVLFYAPTDPHSLLYHCGVTAGTAISGFVLGSVFGAILAIGIVHSRVLEASVMPWVVASQTVPILAIAPMAVVILGNIGLTGLLPKAIICAYLSFFPVTIGMVKGLRSSDLLVAELLKTYHASGQQLFWKLKLPSSLPMLFTGLKVGVAVSTIGAIVAELPTGGTAGLGARLLTGSYYGQTLQIWGALVAAAVLSLALVYTIAAIERLLLGRTGQLR